MADDGCASRAAAIPRKFVRWWSKEASAVDQMHWDRLGQKREIARRAFRLQTQETAAIMAETDLAKRDALMKKSPDFGSLVLTAHDQLDAERNVRQRKAAQAPRNNFKDRHDNRQSVHKIILNIVKGSPCTSSMSQLWERFFSVLNDMGADPALHHAPKVTMQSVSFDQRSLKYTSFCNSVRRIKKKL